MKRRVVLALFPTLAAFVPVLIALSAMVPDRDFSRVDWIGIPGILGFSMLAALLVLPVFLVALGVLVVDARSRRAQSR
jgi:hypothetical protein